MRRVRSLLVLLIGMAAIGSHAADAVRYQGRLLVDVLDEFRNAGFVVVYSTDLVKPDMRIDAEPVADQASTILVEILAPFGLRLERRGGLWLVVQDAERPVSPHDRPAAEPPAISRPTLETVVVHASRYAVDQQSPNARNFLGHEDIDRLIGTGREPLRTIGRLPGAAAAGLSSKQNIRGGEEDEVLLVFDGVPLFEPFHLKDFQNIFSTLDPRVVGSMEVYTGGFPAQYGDRLSGVIDVNPQSPPDSPHHEIGIDFFNVGALSTGAFADGRGEWLASVRRGTLDLVFDFSNQDIGSPTYYDFLAQVQRQFGKSTAWSGSVMLADDSITLNEIDRDSRARADHRTLHAWTVLDQGLTDSLSHRTLLAWIEADNLREGTLNRPDESRGSVLDRRRYNAFHLKQDWSFSPSEDFLARWGAELRRVDARYQYRSELEFFPGDLIAALTGRAGRDLDLAVAPDGNQVGVYLTNRWRFTPKWAAEIGLRWDRQSYIRDVENEQTSPRLSLMYKPTDNTAIRAGWGRFSQAQGVHELQVEDGVSNFFPAQRSAHSVLGVDHKFANDLMLRVEIYRKQMDRLRPRFENLFDQLEILPELASDRVLLEPDEALARGAEIFLRLDRDNKPFSWWLGASFSSVEDSFNGREVPRSWDQARALNLGINWHRGIWRADFAAHYHSGWPTTGMSLVEQANEAVPVLGERNAARFPDFFSIDVRVARRKPLGGNKALTLFFEVTNLSDRKNVCCVDYALEQGPDNTILLEREFDHWLPLIPSVGVIWEF